MNSSQKLRRRDKFFAIAESGEMNKDLVSYDYILSENYSSSAHLSNNCLAALKVSFSFVGVFTQCLTSIRF